MIRHKQVVSILNLPQRTVKHVKEQRQNNAKEGKIGVDNTSGLAGSDFLTGVGDKIGRRTEKESFASHIPEVCGNGHTRISRPRSLLVE